MFISKDVVFYENHFPFPAMFQYDLIPLGHHNYQSKSLTFPQLSSYQPSNIVTNSMEIIVSPKILQDIMSYIQSPIDNSSPSANHVLEHNWPQSTSSNPTKLSQPNNRVTPFQNVCDNTSLDMTFPTPSSIGMGSLFHPPYIYAHIQKYCISMNILCWQGLKLIIANLKHFLHMWNLNLSSKLYPNMSSIKLCNFNMMLSWPIRFRLWHLSHLIENMLDANGFSRSINWWLWHFL